MSWKHTSDSANIAGYKGPDGYWATVLRSEWTKKDGLLYKLIPPHFHVTVRKEGVGEIGCLVHVPKKDPAETHPEFEGRLHPRSVAILAGRVIRTDEEWPCDNTVAALEREELKSA